jgi:hypothetical protein
MQFPPPHVTVHSALCPHDVMQLPPGQSMVHFEEVPQLVMQLPLGHTTLHSADVPQVVAHLPVPAHSTRQLLAVSQLGWQSSAPHVKLHCLASEHLQLAPLHG